MLVIGQLVKYLLNGQMMEYYEKCKHAGGKH